MISIDKVPIIGNSKTLKYYRSRGYVINHGDEIFIKIEDLIPTSSIKIDCYCDICNICYNIKYYNYIGNVSRNGLYRCNDCSKIVRSDKIKILHKNPLDSQRVVNKSKDTNKKRYGVDNPMKLDLFKQKLKKSFIDKFGVDSPLKDISIKNKMYETNIKRYGFYSCFKSIDFRNRVSKILIDKFGVENVFQNEEIKLKIKNTLIEKYGVDNPTKNVDIFNKAQKNSYRVIMYENSEISYQGTYELDFIKFCISNNIYFIKGPTVDYCMNNKSRKYHSDFFIPSRNLVCEIKSSWTYGKDLEENITKMNFTINSGYNFLFIIDKNYTEFKAYLNLK